MAWQLRSTQIGDAVTGARRELGAGGASPRLKRARMLREASWRHLEGQMGVSQLGKKE